MAQSVVIDKLSQSLINIVSLQGKVNFELVLVTDYWLRILGTDYRLSILGIAHILSLDLFINKVVNHVLLVLKHAHVLLQLVLSLL